MFETSWKPVDCSKQPCVLTEIHRIMFLNTLGVENDTIRIGHYLNTDLAKLLIQLSIGIERYEYDHIATCSESSLENITNSAICFSSSSLNKSDFDHITCQKFCSEEQGAMKLSDELVVHPNYGQIS